MSLIPTRKPQPLAFTGSELRPWRVDIPCSCDDWTTIIEFDTQLCATVTLKACNGKAAQSWVVGSFPALWTFMLSTHLARSQVQSATCGDSMSSFKAHPSPLDCFRHDSVGSGFAPRHFADVTMNKLKMSRQYGHQVGVDFWEQRLDLTSKIICGIAAFSSVECQVAEEIYFVLGAYAFPSPLCRRAFSSHSATLFDRCKERRRQSMQSLIARDGRKQSKQIRMGRRSTSWGCTIEWKNRLWVIREGQIHLFKDLSDLISHKPRFLSCLMVIRKSDHLKDSESVTGIEVTPESRILSAKFRTQRATSTHTVFAHDPTDEDLNDFDDEDDIICRQFIPPSTHWEKDHQKSRVLVLTAYSFVGYFRMSAEHLSISEASRFVSSLLPSLESPSTPIPPTPPPTYPSSLLPSLPHNYALAFPEWRMELVYRARKAGMGNIDSVMECLMWGLAHTREEEEVEEDESDAGYRPANDEDDEDDEDEDADYYQEQSDRMALEPSGVVTSIPLLASAATTPPLSSPSSTTGVDGRGRRMSRSCMNTVWRVARVCRRCCSEGGSGSVLKKAKERKKDRARTIHRDEPADAEGKKKSKA
ncbi:hypothetical protein EDD85DRAFT_939044 [Armillaria nabsnona]|nr:hypothetical protein EDD85DRAFT_939044 [Armillaria nabsnona]